MTSSPVLTDLDGLAARVAGPVLTPADPDFAAEVTGFNLAHTPCPSVVVGATSTADVTATVRWAAEDGRTVTVSATGHGLAGDLAGTVLVSTRRLTEVSVDPGTRTARVGGGTRWRQVIDAAAPHGLAPLSGSSSGVGVVGYTLGGGLGPLGRRYGFAADLVRRVELVTADGAVRTVDASSDPELFWALRGGGTTGLGVVTALEFDLVPVAGLHGGGVFFPGAAAAELLHAWREWVGTLGEATTTSIAVLRMPPDPALPPPLRGQTVVHLRFAHLGPADEGAALLAPMRAVAAPLVDLVADMPFAAVDAIHMDPTDPMPTHHDSVALRELPAAAVDALLEAAGPDVDVPLMLVELRHLGGALGRPAAVPNAVAGRDTAFSCWAVGPMAGPLTGVVPGLTAAVVGRLAPWSTGGALPNFAGPGGAGRAWDDAARARLAAVRRRVDPAGVLTP